MAISVVLFFIWENRKNNKAIDNATKIIKAAEEKANNMINNSKKESLDIISKAEKIEERALEKQEKIESKLEIIEEKQEKIQQKEDFLREKEVKIEDLRTELEWKLAEYDFSPPSEPRQRIWIAELRGAQRKIRYPGNYQPSPTHAHPTPISPIVVAHRPACFPISSPDHESSFWWRAVAPRFKKTYLIKATQWINSW